MMLKGIVNGIKNFLDKEFGIIDYILIGLISVLCFVSFLHGDILHTGGSTSAFLNGHFLDMYDYNLSYGMSDAYMPTTYIIFSIWNLPLRILGFLQEPTMVFPLIVRMWFKLLPTLFMYGSAYVVYIICLQAGFQKKICAVASIVFLTSTCAFFSQFMFGQYDSITLFFVLLAIYFYDKDDIYMFSLIFAIPMTTKYFVLLIYIPLLLLKEKRYSRLVFNFLIVISLFVVETIVFRHSSAFLSEVFGFGATNYLFDASIKTAHFSISIVVLLFLVFCAYAHYLNVKKEEAFQYTIWFCMISVFLIFGISIIHPQWLMLAAPFISLACVINKKPNTFLLLGCAFTIVFMGIVYIGWSGALDVNLFNLGIFRNLMGPQDNLFLVAKDVYPIVNSTIVRSVFSGVLLVFAVFSNPKFTYDRPSIPEGFYFNSRLKFFIFLLCFMLPTTYCYFYNDSHTAIFEAVNSDGFVTQPISNGYYVEQAFTVDGTKIDSFEIYVANTYRDLNDNDSIITLYSNKTGEALFSTTINNKTIQDNSHIIIYADIDVIKGQSYTVTIKSNGSNGYGIQPYHGVNNATEYSYAIINGVRQDYSLTMTVLGE